MATTSDTLIARGLLDSVPGASSIDAFLARLVTTIVDDAPLRGAALVRIDSRGRLSPQASFGELNPVVQHLDGQFATDIPLVVSALRDRHHHVPVSEVPFLQDLGSDGWGTALGLTRPGFGFLLLTGPAPLQLTDEAWVLLRTWMELWLARGSQWSGSPQGSQVSATTSSIVFTDRQREVLTLLSNGLTNAEIGKELSISASLAKQEVAFLSHALQAKNRLDTVVQAQRLGILPVG